jgi:hypothetical protein
MKELKIYILFLLLFQIQLCAIAQFEIFEGDNSSNKIQGDLDIYLVIGQSNMAGRATMRTIDTLPIENTHLFTGNELSPWVAATNPLNRYSSVRKNMKLQRLGPSYAFARSMASENMDQDIGLVVNAKGGTKIVQWLPGTELFEEAMKQTHKALKYGKLKGVIWHQGGGDCHPIRVDLYLGRLEILVNAIREEFDDPLIPFVAGQLYENEKRLAFNPMILQLPDFIRNTGVAISDGRSVGDGMHFDSKSAIILGDRYSREMKRIQEVLKNKK